VTGVSSMALDLEGKRLEILKELLPAVSRVAVFSDPANPYSALAMQQVRSAADLLQVKLSDIVVHEKRDIDKAFATIAGDRLEALVFMLTFRYSVAIGSSSLRPTTTSPWYIR
jgi:putative tryptophan/tyrosine transport system substrate-binding protein